MTSNSSESPQELQYPPVQVNHSLSKLDLDTLIMRSTTRRQSGEAGSSLEDSTYELLGDSLLEASDDEAHTESIASTDTPTDGASEFSDDDDDDFENHIGHVQHSVDSLNPEATEQLTDSHLLPGGEDSTLTEVPDHMDGSESLNRVRLDEEPTDKSNMLYGSKVTRSYPDHTSDLPSVFTQYECSEIRLVVKAALSDRPMPTPNSYKILYVGKPERWLVETITSQIGHALIASPSASRSVMVGGQFETYGPIIDTYRCISLTTVVSDSHEAFHATFNLDDGRQITLTSQQASGSENQPDLVVFCHPSVPGSAEDLRDFATAREVVRRHSLPYIDLAEVRRYGGGAPTYDSHSLSVCIEGRNDETDDYKLKEVLPLDHYLFSELEPSQLNRHLALISPHLTVLTPTLTPKARDSPSNTSTGKVRWILSLFFKILVAYIVPAVMTMVLAYFVVWTATPALMHRVPNIHVDPSTLVSFSTISSSLAATTTPPAVSALSAPSLNSFLEVVAPSLPQMSQKKHKKQKPVVEKVENVNVFNIEVTGDHQFVLRPSTDSPSNRNIPQIQIQVTQNLRIVPVRSNRVVDGAYVVDLEHEYPPSDFYVSIATHSQSVQRQSFKVILGHNKPKLVQLLDMAGRTIRVIQGDFQNMSSTVSQHIQKSELANHFEGAKKILEDKLNAGAEQLRRMKVGNMELLKDVPGATWMGLRKVSAPVRTSTPMLKARMNALRLRCKMEVATSLVTEEQSWACTQVRGNVQG